ncbi:hypothetical protein D3C87_1975710 [compost metagenome]
MHIVIIYDTGYTLTNEGIGFRVDSDFAAIRNLFDTNYDMKQADAPLPFNNSRRLLL